MVLAEDLRQAVLQAALQGKLTKQLETDSDVDEWLANIQAEKEKLIADKKIKKEKPLPEIQEEDIPFDIPDNWRWVRLQTFLDVRDGTHDSPKYVENGVPFVTSKNLNNGKIDFSDIKYITKEDADFFNTRSKVDRNDILMAMIGSIGKPVLVDIEEEFAIKNMALFKQVPSSDTNMPYVLLLLNYAENIMKIQSTGGVQKFISLTYLREFISPLPPIEEQQRIVDKINEIMPMIDEYEKIEKELEALKKEFPADMKDALLQAAMQGKLTEQLESDSSVDELLAAIKQEKEELIAQKKIKREKPLPDIEGDEIPFDIPENWQWVRLKDIALSNIGLTYKPSDKTLDGVIVLRSSNIQNGKMDYNDIVRVSMEIPENKMCALGDVLMCVRNGSKSLVGKVAMIDRSNMSFGAFMAIIRSRCNQFLYYFFNSNIFKKQMHINSSTETINQITQDMLFNCIIPLPPIAEQQRIVERLDALLPLCEGLKE